MNRGDVEAVVARHKGKKAICAIGRGSFFNPSYLRGHFDAHRLLFSSFDSRGRWQVFEVWSDGSAECQGTLLQVRAGRSQPLRHSRSSSLLPSSQSVNRSSRGSQWRVSPTRPTSRTMLTR